MSELAPPMDQFARAAARLESIDRLTRQISRLEAQRRLELAAFAREDCPGFRKFAGDVLALHVAESPSTADRWLQDAQVFAAYPEVVGLIESERWTPRHADALLDEIVGFDLTDAVQAAVIGLVTSHPDARTPYQVRKAARAAVMVLDPAAAEKRFRKAKEDRGVTVGTDGTAAGWLCARGTVSQAAMLDAALTAQAGPKQPGDDRTMSQRRFDALMDLVCGRAAPVSWEAQVLVDLATVEGGDRPAEVPGFGLVCAEEAREVVARASLRRMVVDEDGRLVAVDGTVHRPDLADAVPAAERRVSGEVEPEPSTDPEPEVDAADEAWLLAQLEEQAPGVDPLVEELCSDLEGELRRLLEQHALVGSGGRSGLCVDLQPACTHVEIGRDYPPDHGSGGTGPPPDDPPPDDPPSFDDRVWNDSTLDREAQDASLPWPAPVLEDTPGGPPPPDPRAWSPNGFLRALGRMAAAPVDHRPLVSSSYTPSSRLARHIKARDQTCRFPDCRRLARTAEMDHVVPYPHGPTDERNLTNDCTHHHQAKHAVFQVHRTDDGTLHWTTPFGLTVSQPLRPLLRGW